MKDKLLKEVKDTIFESVVLEKMQAYESRIAKEKILARLHYVLRDNLKTFKKVFKDVDYGDRLYAGKIFSYTSDFGDQIWLGVEVKGKNMYITLNKGDMVHFDTFYKNDVDLDEKDIYDRDWFEAIIREFFSYGYSVQSRMGTSLEEQGFEGEENNPPIELGEPEQIEKAV